MVRGKRASRERTAVSLHQESAFALMFFLRPYILIESKKYSRVEQWDSRSTYVCKKDTLFLFHFTIIKSVSDWVQKNPEFLSEVGRSRKVHSSLSITLNILFPLVCQILSEHWPTSYWLQQREMQSNIPHPSAVMPGWHVDSWLFSEQHEWTFIIHEDIEHLLYVCILRIQMFHL